MIALGVMKMLYNISSHFKDGGGIDKDKDVCHSFKLDVRLFTVLNKLKLPK